MNPLVSIIVPIYNVDPYLDQCVYSLIKQTYQNIEIILVDDGSPDQCGSMCDLYRTIDSRILVIHQNNQGLSCARNVGIEIATGEYIMFVDSDDWVEPNIVDILINHALRNRADLVVCGFVNEFKNRVSSNYKNSGSSLLLNRGDNLIVRNTVWGKIYHSYLFKDIRFPEDRMFEDLATTYRILAESEKTICIDEPLYHYRRRKSSISNNHSEKELIDFWTAQYEKYNYIKRTFPTKTNGSLQRCIFTIIHTWCWLPGCCIKQNKETVFATVSEMKSFAKSHLRIVLKGTVPLKTKLYCIIALTDNPLIMKGLYYINRSRKGVLNSIYKPYD